MRLINTTDLRFKEFFDSQRPPYAILSHTWGSEEVSYLDLLFLTSDLSANALGAVQVLLRNPGRDTEGYRKVEACCKVARERGFDWVWIDSCCIDKSSSAELSEAINSMWQWYRDAQECYVFLSDVSLTAEQLRADEEALKAARWFTRGWTLQELLAPKYVYFHNNQWEYLAEKAELAGSLAAITKIPEEFLSGTYDASKGHLCSVAMKMSWLACRHTTRIEDMAYCMLGLFDVHMPLIYGEGRKAFMRLQLEIIARVNDPSIYAWTARVGHYGLLAQWPTWFADSGNIVQIKISDDRTPDPPPVMTSIGLEVRTSYSRNDPQQLAIDKRHFVQTLSISRPTVAQTLMVMRCCVREENTPPVTRMWMRGAPGNMLIIHMKRFGSLWRRIKCEKLEFQRYDSFEPKEFNAHRVFYVPQEEM